ncbi:hypothetical protein GGQ68_002606 [Sagittula marina]|uniref:Uncharacterized protein n=1 Tax=Sagittula marina TaxID=943940 RepID=A0A7W6GSX6_9RHOB|nr:hypothetical protein [Sagittula marina]MBB3986267.1 hypothetical protein [Sagittula marina]
MSKTRQDFRDKTAQDCLAALAAMPRKQHLAQARLLIYKKGQRPRDLGEQFDLLDGLTKDPVLTEFDRLYALIAGGHKLSEQVSPLSSDWLDRMVVALDEVLAMPIGYGLRKDRTHLVFSALNVMMNLDLATGAHQGDRLAQISFDEAAALNLRRMTPYLFNSVCNLVKVVGIALLHRPDAAHQQAERCAKLMSYAIEINNSEHWWVFSRFKAPRRVDDLSLRAAFGSFRNTMKRLDAIEQAANADAAARRPAFEAVADLCVGQAQPAQKAALIAAASRVLDRTVT